MKIWAFRVTPRAAVSLDAVLTHIAALPITDRLRPISNVPTRLEDAVKNGHFWLLDFGLIRHAGPGRAGPEAPIADFDMEADEGFGEETAAYFDTESGFMSLQYNHYGPKHARIQAYLHRFACIVAGEPERDEPLEGGPGFNLTPLLKVEAANSLDRMGIVKTIDMSFYVPGIVAQDANRRRSLSGLLDLPLLGAAKNVRLQVSAGRGAGSLGAANVRQTVAELLGMSENLGALHLTGKQDEDAATEPIDLLEARLDCNIPVVMGNGRRYPRDARLAALRQAFETWRANGLLR